jgi:hypothetical protein
MRTVLTLCAVALAACGSGSSSPPLPLCSAALPAGATAAVGPGGAAACSEGAAPTLTAVSDLSVDGYAPIGGALAVAAGGPSPHGVDVVLPFVPSKLPSGRAPELVILAQLGNAPAHAAPVSNVAIERARVHFHVAAWAGSATFQPALPVAAPARTRHYTFRALAGVSMGGLGSSMNFWRHPDQWDALGVMGADPGPDLTYTAVMIRDFFLGGFCDSSKPGQLCAPTRRPLDDQLERGSTFEHFLFEAGDGTGLTLRRSLYLRANRDLARALGNGAYYNPDSTYLPSGVPASTLGLANAAACATPVVLKKFYDARYNPDGKYDVISFCDGNDSQTLGFGVFDPSIMPTNPAQILLAVDINGNGRRDSGEPVVVQGSEPWRDVGSDGKASVDEPGYDPVSNPDPSGDDYHYLWNPTGTENNWRYDAGEPYDDLGIDGVARTVGGCPAMSGVAGCYDYGEGNGKFDYSPNILNWRAHDPHTLAEALDAGALARIDTYYDAGIRDFFNAQVSTNSLMGALEARGASVRVFDGFPALVGAAPSEESRFNIKSVDLGALGHHVYVRYGDPDLTEDVVEATGDGRHAGSAIEVVHRSQMLMSFIASRWPGGDRTAPAPLDAARARIEDRFTTSTGRDTPYTVVVPPGYFQPENAQTRYPVLYFMHGYGMEPDTLASISVVAQNAMVDTSVPESRRMQKFILVLVDGKCRPGGDIEAGGPLPSTGDLCEEGTFYSDHPEGGYHGEGMLAELMAVIDAGYRTKPAADVQVN